MVFLITEEFDNKSLLSFLQNGLSVSRKAISRLKRLEKGMMLNGERVTVRALLHKGDSLHLELDDLPEETDPYLDGVYYPLDILYEDEHIIVPCKPPSMPMHQSLGHKNDSLANALAFYFSGKPFIFRAVNRLDRDTSGVCIIAKTRQSAMLLSSQVANKEMHKTYHAFLEGTLDPAEGIIDRHIRRKEESIITRIVCNPDEPGAQQALTRYKTLKAGGSLSLVECSPVTGRTHQLRVHFASFGCPILGDTLYGRESGLIKRQALYASSVEFCHPATGKKMCISAPLPDDMKNLIV